MTLDLTKMSLGELKDLESGLKKEIEYRNYAEKAMLINNVCISFNTLANKFPEVRLPIRTSNNEVIDIMKYFYYDEKDQLLPEHFELNGDKND